MSGVFEDQQGSQCDWSKVSEREKVVGNEDGGGAAPALYVRDTRMDTS